MGICGLLVTLTVNFPKNLYYVLCFYQYAQLSFLPITWLGTSLSSSPVSEFSRRDHRGKVWLQRCRRAPVDGELEARSSCSPPPRKSTIISSQSWVIWIFFHVGLRKMEICGQCSKFFFSTLTFKPK